MIYVCTVHWHDERWIPLQRRFLRRHLPVDHAVYASLNGIDAVWKREFDFAADLEGSHPVKLNALANEVMKVAGADDLLLFVDSDAFPIAPVDRDLLGGTPLAAVRRDENMGQQQPHPCFCLTTVGFWEEIQGDWRRGYEWAASNGLMVTDAGGNLLGLLRARGIPWRPLLRTNRFDLDPLWFAVYGDVAYHHGAGSREPVSLLADLPAREAMLRSVERALLPARLPALGRLERSVRYRLGARRRERTLAEYAERSRRLSDEVLGWIEADDDFYRRFLERSSAAGPT